MLFCMSGDQGYRFFAAGFRRGNHLRVFPPAKGMVDPPWGHPDHLRLCSDETLKKKSRHRDSSRLFPLIKGHGLLCWI